jgi:hypothetical protein
VNGGKNGEIRLSASNKEMEEEKEKGEYYLKIYLVELT